MPVKHSLPVTARIKAPSRKTAARPPGIRSTRGWVRITLFLTLAACAIAYWITMGAPRWYAYRYAHASIADLQASCSSGQNTAACTTLGQKLIAAKHPEQALGPLQNCWARISTPQSQVPAPEQANVAGTLAEALMLSNRVSEAPTYFREAIHRDSDCVPAHLAFAFWLQNMQIDQLALNEVKIVTVLDPRNDLAWFLMAHLYNGNNSVEQARAAARKAIAINPKIPSYWQELGDSYGYAGLYAESLPPYREELRLAPDAVTAQADVARALAMGAATPAEYQEARALVTDVMHRKHLEDGSAYSMLGDLYFRFHHFAEARAALGKAIQYDHSIPNNYYELSLSCRLTGDPKGADLAMSTFRDMEAHYRHTSTLQKQLAEHEDDPELHIALAREWERYKLWPNALREYRAAMHLRLGDPLATKKVAELAHYAAPKKAILRNWAVTRLLKANAEITIEHGPLPDAPQHPSVTGTK